MYTYKIIYKLGKLLIQWYCKFEDCWRNVTITLAYSLDTVNIGQD